MRRRRAQARRRWRCQGVFLHKLLLGNKFTCTPLDVQRRLLGAACPQRPSPARWPERSAYACLQAADGPSGASKRAKAGEAAPKPKSEAAAKPKATPARAAPAKRKSAHKADEVRAGAPWLLAASTGAVTGRPEHGGASSGTQEEAAP